MIRLIDVFGEKFNLLKTRATDRSFFSKRDSFGPAVLEAVKSPSEASHASLFRTDGRYFVTRFYTTFNKATGELTVGCHGFDKKSSRIIIRWAKGKA